MCTRWYVKAARAGMFSRRIESYAMGEAMMIAYHAVEQVQRHF
jgi:hypothetical protein